MKIPRLLRCLPVILGSLVALLVRGQAPLPDVEITSFAQNGQLTFTVLPGYTNYVVEWAPTVGGPWSGSWDGLRVTEPSAGEATVAVPMFYRVVARGTPVAVPAGMGYVPASEFEMGDAQSLATSALPVHSVRLGSFLIERFEVTRDLWDSVYDWALTHGYQFENPGASAAGNHPANGINWHDAVKWCNARSEKEGLVPTYYTDGTRTAVFRTGVVDLTNACVEWGSAGYRLPTEAEWERAARGGLDGQHFTWPSGDPDYWRHVFGTLANFWNSGDPFDNGTTPVGFYDGTQAVGGVDVKNTFGLYDVSGNVAELCWDRMGPYSTGLETDPHGPDTGDQRVVRGGSWYDQPDQLRLASRQSVYSHHAPPTQGLRCVRTAER